LGALKGFRLAVDSFELTGQSQEFLSISVAVLSLMATKMVLEKGLSDEESKAEFQRRFREAENEVFEALK